MAATPSASKCFLVTGPPVIFFSKSVISLLSVDLTVSRFAGRGEDDLDNAGEVREGSDRVGFEVVTLDGMRGPLASSKISSTESLRWPTVGKYKVDVESFESLALPQMQVKEGTNLFIIDEVGKMELYSSSFFPAVLRILDSNVPFLASIPIPKFGRDIPGVARLRNHPGATIFTLDPGNRDAMKDRIYSQIVLTILNVRLWNQYYYEAELSVTRKR
ncbi:hypothetical protein ZIOFF_001930 [Zingiber officinale]|uniref:Uncharacterized protein n=1 Tax=Zingiber officinale TaxID=94328 RepID=A0A8J5I6B3_ZINOF|nr:hypothetical protein ZIOFF_001930 [Zingiber officinale]